MAEVYNSLKPQGKPYRTLDSMRSRKKALFKALVKFSGFYAVAVRSKVSGTNLDDLVKLATGLYNGKQMTNITDNAGPAFKHYQSWTVIRHHPKFNICDQSS